MSDWKAEEETGTALKLEIVLRLKLFVEAVRKLSWNQTRAEAATTCKLADEVHAEADVGAANFCRCRLKLRLLS